MGNTGSTPEEVARKKSPSDFANHPSLTPIDPPRKQPLPAFVPIMSVPEGHVHKVQESSGHTFQGCAVTLPSDPNTRYLFQPNRTVDHLSGKESKIRYIRHFGNGGRTGKLYFLRTRTVERKEDATEEQKMLMALLDQIKSQNMAFKTLELEQMRKVERALEEMVALVDEQQRTGSTADLRINSLLKGDIAELTQTIVDQWLSKVKDAMAPENQQGWGKLKTQILRAKPWSKPGKKQSEILQDTMQKVDEEGTGEEGEPGGESGTLPLELQASLSGSLSFGGMSLGSLSSTLAEYGDAADLTAEERRILLATPDTESGEGDLGLGDTLGDLHALEEEREAELAEEVLEMDQSLLADYLQDLAAAEPDFQQDEACELVAKVFEECGDFLRALYRKYSVANEDSSTGSSVPVVQFQIFVLEVNCAIEESEAKDVYDSMCGFDWDKAPKKIMQLNLFAHALVRAGSLYLENIMSQSSNPGFKDFDGKQVSSHLLELLRHCNVELEMDMTLPEAIPGVPDIRVKTITSESGDTYAADSGDSGEAAGSDADGDEPDDKDDPEAHLKLNSKFRIDSQLLEDLCEEVEDPAELQTLLGELMAKVKELEKVIIGQFAEAMELGPEEKVNTRTPDQHLSREAFIVHAAQIDSLIDTETSDDVFSQLCGYPFEKVQKPMDLHVYVHAWVRLANLYSMFASPDGNADFVDIVSQLDFLAEMLRARQD